VAIFFACTLHGFYFITDLYFFTDKGHRLKDLKLFNFAPNYY